MTQARKFNVGDVVIDLQDLGLWHNPYHHKKTLATFKQAVVVGATDKLFTTDHRVDIEKVGGFSDWHVKNKVAYQDTGRGYDGTQAYINLTTRRRDVEAHLKKLLDTELARCDKEDEEMIARLEAEIAFKQRQIENVRAGKRTLSYNHQIVEREHLQECFDGLMKALK